MKRMAGDICWRNIVVRVQACKAGASQEPRTHNRYTINGIIFMCRNTRRLLSSAVERLIPVQKVVRSIRAEVIFFSIFAHSSNSFIVMIKQN